MNFSVKVSFSAFISFMTANLLISQETVLDNGTSNEFSGTLVGWYQLTDSLSGDITRLTVRSPGSISGDHDKDVGVILSDRSVLTFLGGDIGEDIWAKDHSTVYMSGGTVWDDLYAEGYSTVHLSGGTVTDDLELHNTAELYFSGGFVGEDFEVGDSAFAIMTGGTVNGDTAVFDYGSLYISGGTFLGNDEGGMFSVLGGSLTLSGSDFSIGGSSVDYGTISSVDGLLTGTLLDGSALSIYLYVDDESSVTFSATAIPEPSTYAALLGGVAFGVLVLRRHRRKRFLGVSA